jgi:hypothetical protein
MRNATLAVMRENRALTWRSIRAAEELRSDAEHRPRRVKARKLINDQLQLRKRS